MRKKCSRLGKNQCSQLRKLGVHAREKLVFTVGKNTQRERQYRRRKVLALQDEAQLASYLLLQVT